MSKDKPEVGDIFYCETHQLSLIVTLRKYDLLWGIWETGQSFSCWKSCDIEVMVYMGKSKCKVEDLFKTENE